MKDAEYKDLWDVELGVTYIPWEKLPQDLTHLMEGGMIDEETVPDHLKGKPLSIAKKFYFFYFFLLLSIL